MQNGKIEGLVTFEESIGVIDEELAKRRGRWKLDFLAWIDYDDVCQKIRFHIFKKWDQWDQSRPLKPWLNTIIRNQIYNLIRNNYVSFSRPCISCKFNMGGNFCSLYGTQSDDCEDFSKWERGKKNAKEIKMPLSLDAKGFFSNSSCDEEDLTSWDIKDTNIPMQYDEKIKQFSEIMRGRLTETEWKIFDCLYIKNLSELETAQEMGYKTSEKNRSPGYKQIKKVKNKIYDVAKDVVFEL